MAYEVVEAEVEGVGEEGRSCSDSEGGSSSSFRVDSFRIGRVLVRKKITRSSGNYQVRTDESLGSIERRVGTHTIDTLAYRTHHIHHRLLLTPR